METPMRAAERDPAGQTSVAAPALGDAVGLRTAMRGDGARLRRMFRRLSPESLYRYFFVAAPHTAHYADQLARLGDPGDDGQAVVAGVGDEVVGIACYRHAPGDGVPDVSILIEDAWQGRGLGRSLLGRLEAWARRRGVAAVKGALLAENRRALRLVRAIWPNATVRFVEGEWHFYAQLDSTTREPDIVLPAAPRRGRRAHRRGDGHQSTERAG